MNVGVVVPGFSAHAADWCIPALRDFVGCLGQRADVRVISVRYPYCSSRYEIDGVPVIALGGSEVRGARSLRLWQRALATFAAEHRRRRFDVLHAFWATESGLLAAMAGRLLGIPTLVSLAGGELVALPVIGYGDQRFAWERLKVRLALLLATAVSAGSASLVERARRVARLPSVRQLPLGVDTLRFQAESNTTKTASRGLSVLHVGTLTPVKDQATLLHAFALTRQQDSSARLIVAGDGPLRGSLVETARRLGIAEAVEFRGDVDHGSLAPLYQQTDVFAVTSRYEAQSMVALESIACGTPVVGTRVGVVPEIGSAANVGDAGGLAALLLASDRAPRASQALPGSFELAACTARFLDTYRSIGA